jgi:hypothetical protein
MLLNSITFPVQVVLRSKKLDITKYVEKVQRVESKITDPLMKFQAESYRKFVQDIIKTNEVLDKRFYVVVPTIYNYSEPNSSPFDWLGRLLGTKNKRVSFNPDKLLDEARTQLIPKADHMIGEFHRLGIKVKQLNTQELVELYFDIYNPSSVHGQRIRTNIEDYRTAIVSPAILEE